MTLAAALSSLVLICSAAPARTRPQTSKWQQGQEAFVRGNFDSALRALDAAALETGEGETLAKIHLLRGQCFAAMQELNATEEAFTLALDYNPAAELDPAKVDPSLVRLLNRLRDRLQGELLVRTDPVGAKVFVDSKFVGVTPYKGVAAVGHRKVEVQTTDGQLVGSQEVVVFAKRTTSAQVSLYPVAIPATVGLDAEPIPKPRAIRPLAELRGQVTPIGPGPDAALELSGGLERQWLRASLGFQLVPSFGLTPRGAVGVPVGNHVRLFAELELPVIFSDAVAFGLGGSGGTEYMISDWLGFFGQVGVRHYFTGHSGSNQLIFQFGTRLRIPHL